MDFQNADVSKVREVEASIKTLSDVELSLLVCNLIGVTMQKINLAYHLPINDTMELIEDGKFTDEAMKGMF